MLTVQKEENWITYFKLEWKDVYISFIKILSDSVLSLISLINFFQQNCPISQYSWLKENITTQLQTKIPLKEESNSKTITPKSTNLITTNLNLPQPHHPLPRRNALTRQNHSCPHMVLYVTLMEVFFRCPQDALYQRCQEIEVWRPEDVSTQLPQDVPILLYR